MADNSFVIVSADSENQEIVLPKGTYAIESNLTITNRVVFSEGAMLKPADGVTITMLGGFEAGDNQQIFDLSNVTWKDASNPLANPLVLEKTDFVTPGHFGGVGDRAADDTSAIQDAIFVSHKNEIAVVGPSGAQYRYSDNLWIPGAASLKGGHYLLDSRVTNQAMVINCGINMLGATLANNGVETWTGSIDGVTFEIGPNYEIATDPEPAPPPPSSARLINLHNCSGVGITNCEFDFESATIDTIWAVESANNAAYSNNISVRAQVRLLNNYAHANQDSLGGQGLGLSNVTGAQVANNVVSGFGDDPLAMHNCQEFIVSNNHVQSVDGRILLSSPRSATIVGNYVERTNRPGGGVVCGGALMAIEVENSFGLKPKNVVVSGNILKHNSDPCQASGTFGLRVQGAENVCITGNQVIDHGHEKLRGITLQQQTAYQISGSGVWQDSENEEPSYSYNRPCTFDHTTNQVTIAGHGLSVGESLVFDPSGTLPVGITSLSIYQVESVVNVDNLTIKQGGNQVTFTDNGTGPFFAHLRPLINCKDCLVVGNVAKYDETTTDPTSGNVGPILNAMNLGDARTTLAGTVFDVRALTRFRMSNANHRTSDQFRTGDIALVAEGGPNLYQYNSSGRSGIVADGYYLRNGNGEGGDDYWEAILKTLDTAGNLSVAKTEATPTDPLSGHTTIWMSDGHAEDNLGSAGDIIQKTTDPNGQVRVRALDSSVLLGELNVDSALVGHWNGEGKSPQDVLGGSGGTAVGALEYRSQLAKLPGAAFKFPASGIHIEVDTDFFSGATAFTICAFIYPTALPTGFVRFSPFFGDLATNKSMPTIRYNNLGEFQAAFSDGTTIFHLNTTVEVQQNSLQHVAATYDGTDFRFYLNGMSMVSDNSFPNKTLVDDNDPGHTPRIGGGGSTSADAFPGYVGDVRAYTRALTAGELLALASLR